MFLILVSNPFLVPFPDSGEGCLQTKCSRQEGVFLDSKNRVLLSLISSLCPMRSEERLKNKKECDNYLNLLVHFIFMQFHWE